jgi:hypothetical protein
VVLPLHRVDDRKSGIDTAGLLVVAVERRFSMRDFNALVRAAYIEALEFGGDPDEAFETALNLINEAEPDLERDDACRLMRKIVAERPIIITGVKSLPPRRRLA